MSGNTIFYVSHKFYYRNFLEIASGLSFKKAHFKCLAGYLVRGNSVIEAEFNKILIAKTKLTQNSVNPLSARQLFSVHGEEKASQKGY